MIIMNSDELTSHVRQGLFQVADPFPVGFVLKAQILAIFAVTSSCTHRSLILCGLHRQSSIGIRTVSDRITQLAHTYNTHT